MTPRVPDTAAQDWLAESARRLEAAGVTHPRLAARLFNRPLMVRQSVLEMVVASMAPRLGLPVAADAGSPFLEPASARTQRRDLALHDGVAVIDIVGELVHDTYGLEPWSGLLPYQAIAADLDAALADPDTRGILLRVNSPGGEVAGVFDLADAIRAADAVKPVAAIAADLAASAGYLIASAAGRVFATQSAITGSVGVVAELVDVTGMRAAQGVKVTLIQAGARKTDGHPEKSLDGDARAAIQGEVDRYMDLFAGKAAEFRGMSEAQLRGLEAGVFIGDAAIGAGLVDAIATEEEALAWLRARTRETNDGQTAFAPRGRAKTQERNPTGVEPMKPVMNADGAPAPESSDDTETAEAAASDAMDGDDEDEEDKPAKGGDQASARRASGGGSARASGYSEAREIVGLCSLAGRPDLADDFLARGLSRAQAQASLMSQRAHGAEGATDPVAPAGPAARAPGKGFLQARMRQTLESRGLQPASGVLSR